MKSLINLMDIINTPNKYELELDMTCNKKIDGSKYITIFETWT